MSASRIVPDTVVDGRYRVRRLLGAGGMADVFSADDAELGRRVALKVLHRRFAEDPEFVERFRREASSAAGLQHPNIVSIFDRGQWDGLPYIAMELVDGRTLKEIVQEQGPLDPGRATDLTEDILRAARYAHRHGIIHRDLKPHNVIVDEEGRAEVADFGVARAGASEMTETGTIIGTAHYLSPEQAQGQPVSPRSDLYSTGVILYELLTGRVPFDAEAPVTIALKHVSEPPVPPSQLNPSVPPALEAVVMRALEKDPARRFPDADAFIAALEDARRAPAVVAREVVMEPAPGEPWEEERGPRWWLWLLALLLLAAIALGAYLLLRPERVVVPRAIGLRAATAVQVVQNRGLEARVVNANYDTVPRGSVATQAPQPGDKVKKGSTVILTVSAGPGQASVPVVTGLRRRQAEDALRRAGFKPRTTQAFSDTVPTGRVISSTPAEGTTVDKGTTVTLRVSRGRQRVAVPDLRGATRSEASQTLRDAGLQAQFSEREDANAQAGTVIDQDPAADTPVTKGATVSVVLAKAPPKPRVPDVTSTPTRFADASRQIKAAGFRVRRRNRTVTDRAQDGIVLRQVPDAGQRRSKGATVVLTVGAFKPSSSPSPSPSPSPTDTPSATSTPTP